MDEHVPVRDAATVMLVRDGRDGVGLEVFMLRRSLDSAFVAGAYVFPGGAVDDADRHADLEPICEGRSDDDASIALGLDPSRGGLAYWVAAVRECFEEAGVLLAYDRRGAIVDLSDAVVADRFSRARRDVYSGERRLVDLCLEEGLRLAVDRIHYFSHWITPAGEPRRFDTRFFVARAPESQSALHDDGEVIANTWVTPAEALARGKRGEIDLRLPTVRNLRAIARFADVDELTNAAAAMGPIPAILPRVVEDGGGKRILLPGDPDY